MLSSFYIDHSNDKEIFRLNKYDSYQDMLLRVPTIQLFEVNNIVEVDILTFIPSLKVTALNF